MKAFKKKAQIMFRYAPVRPDITVAERFELAPFGFNAYILHTPGHTKGSLSIIVDDEIAFTGDNMVGLFECSLFPPFGDNVPGIIRSWKTLLETGCNLFIPVHGTPKKRQILQKHYEKLSRKYS
jgi:glyoxylase-like metal-dependent hydrolase (beta-lactamase superfamily II)